MPQLATNALQIGYGGRSIVDHLNIAIPDGRITAILGPNGCGKSTLLKAMARILPHQAGSVLLDGKSIHRMNTKELARRLAVLPQTPEGPGGLTVGELVSYGRFPYQRGFGRLTPRDVEAIEWALAATGISEFTYRPVDALSGGQRQRAWIAMALAQETEIVLLDEPTTYLDMAHQLEVLELLHRLNAEQGRTIVMVLHDINHAARFADYLIAMKDGEVVKSGSPNDVVCREVLRDVYRIEAHIGTDPWTGKPMCTTYRLCEGADEQDEKDRKVENEAADRARDYADVMS